MANTRITQGVIKPNEDYDTRHINSTGIVTTTGLDVNGNADVSGNLSVGGVLTYEDVTNVDSVGLITARKGIISSGVVTATAFHGSGASLTGIDATALKDSAGDVKVQAQASGAVHTGISTFDTVNVGSGVTIESNGQATFVGVVTFGPSSTKIDNNTINVGTALTLGHTQGLQFHTQNLHSQGFEINQINASGIITASSFSGDGSNLTSLPAGLGTALSSVQSSPLNKIYYTNSVLGIDNNTTIDVPASASAAYTQYTDINIASGVDLIISDGDDLIPDVLGLRPDGTYGGGSIGRIRVDKLVGKDANSAINVEKGLIIAGVTSTTSAFQVNGATSLANTNQATFDYNTSQARILSHNSSGSSIAFFTNSGGSNVTQKVIIDSSGRMLLGTSDANHYPDRMVTISRDAGSGIELRNNSSSTGQISFSDTSGSGTGAYRGYIQFQHNNGSMHFATQSTERLVLTREGNANFSGIATATAFVPTTGQLSHRNIIVNGDCRIAQRGASSTSAGYKTVDRFRSAFSGNDEGPTQSQFGVSAPGQYHLPTSGPHPYKEGFRQAFGLTNGNQTSGAGAGDNSEFIYAIEAKDLLYSGWDYTNPNSYITLSFWVKSSAAQNFYFFLKTSDGTNKMYPMDTGNLAQFTWKKITKTIPGHSDLSFDDNANEGMRIDFPCYYGTNYTNNSTSLDAWANYNGAARTPDHATTWYTTNDASFQITGLQLEVGPVATPFEHLSYGENLRRCERYFQCLKGPNLVPSGTTECLIGTGFAYTSSRVLFPIIFKTEMRSNPTVSVTTQSDLQALGTSGGWNSSTSFTDTNNFHPMGGRIDMNFSGSPLSAGNAAEVRLMNSSILGFDAEI